LIVGYYFGTEKIIERFLFINEQLVYDVEDSHNLTRIMIINFGLENIKNFFLFGYGLGGFETLFQVNFDITDDKYANHVHSDLIQIFGELGLFGFTLLILSISKFFLYKIFYDKLNILLLFYLLIFLSFDFSLQIPLIQILFIIFFIFNKKSRTSSYDGSS
jgi:O-antigen ligase